ncbi:MAG: phospholipase D-like domain-containing protein [Candidatus Gastranaerophilales bacterium]|nr:phospholipase D-like domain-containing protein [Candidatus Gastranaerophilales bacterium]
MKNISFIISVLALCVLMFFIESSNLDWAQSNEVKSAAFSQKNIHKIKCNKPSPKPYIAPNEPNVPYFSDGVVSLYVTNPVLFLDAKENLRTAIAKNLVQEINNAKHTIDFAVYGVEGQPSVIQSLIAAQNRCVRVRWVTDMDAKGSNIYADTQKTIQFLKECMCDSNILSTQKNALMHNKFFIIDGETLITGSANVSNTDLSGFNSNVYLKIKSPEICDIYQKEFDQMYQGLFHNVKNQIDDKTNIKLKNGNIVSVYFSPKDKTISNAIVPLIDGAQKYVYMPVFFLTDKNTAQALIRAQKRGVDVRVILDATAAANGYSVHKDLRAQGVKVKVENWAGKMHQKSLIIDDETVVIGSMNFSKSGENKNDENCVVITNAPELAQKSRDYFLMLYGSIPNKWLTQNPKAESTDSIGSCSDGVDNDFDGKIDAQDSGCFTFYSNKPREKKKIYR